MKVPVDFVIVPSWQVNNILCSLLYTKLIFPGSHNSLADIDSDLP